MYKVELEGQINPAGAGAIVDSGWAYSQYLNTRSWISSTNAYTDSSGLDSWAPNFEDDAPSTNDCIFLIDMPKNGSASGLFPFKENWNFQTWVSWNGQLASDFALWYVRVKAHPSGETYMIDTDTAGPGNPAFDTSF